MRYGRRRDPCARRDVGAKTSHGADRRFLDFWPLSIVLIDRMFHAIEKRSLVRLSKSRAFSSEADTGSRQENAIG